IPGGGVAYVRALPALEKLKLGGEQDFGVEIIRRAIVQPMWKIASNAGLEGAVVINKVREGKGAYGFNARTEVYEDLEKAGVIDPTKVARSALVNAASVASLLLTTEAMVADAPPKRKGKGGGGGGGGMPDYGGGDDMDM
ncbi:MAG: groL, partial [Myxococcaceae bacterium]|nr:groL [Myxococcaceae bacterium]